MGADPDPKKGVTLNQKVYVKTLLETHCSPLPEVPSAAEQAAADLAAADARVSSDPDLAAVVTLQAQAAVEDAHAAVEQSRRADQPHMLDPSHVTSAYARPAQATQALSPREENSPTEDDEQRLQRRLGSDHSKPSDLVYETALNDADVPSGPRRGVATPDPPRLRVNSPSFSGVNRGSSRNTMSSMK